MEEYKIKNDNGMNEPKNTNRKEWLGEGVSRNEREKRVTEGGRKGGYVLGVDGGAPSLTRPTYFILAHTRENAPLGVVISED